MNFEREYKISKQMYLLQRLLNEDERCSKDNMYLFMAASLVEQDQLERQISISGVKGVCQTSIDGYIGLFLLQTSASEPPVSLFEEARVSWYLTIPILEPFSLQLH